MPITRYPLSPLHTGPGAPAPTGGTTTDEDAAAIPTFLVVLVASGVVTTCVGDGNGARTVASTGVGNCAVAVTC
jgi:hypothetical protein